MTKEIIIESVKRSESPNIYASRLHRSVFRNRLKTFRTRSRLVICQIDRDFRKVNDEADERRRKRSSNPDVFRNFLPILVARYMLPRVWLLIICLSDFANVACFTQTDSYYWHTAGALFTTVWASPSFLFFFFHQISKLLISPK